MIFRTLSVFFCTFTIIALHTAGILADLPHEEHLIPLIYVNEEIVRCLQGSSPRIVHTAFEDCFTSYFDFQNLTDGSTLHTILNERMCALPSPKTCLANRLSGMKDTCFDNKDWADTTTNVGLHMTETAYNYICDNQGQRIREFFKGENEACVTRFHTNSPEVSPLLHCVMSLSQDYETKFNEANTKNDKHAIEEVRCRFFTEAIKCGHDNLHCDNRKPIEMVEEMAREVLLKARNCDKYLNSGKNITPNLYSSLFVIVLSILGMTVTLH